MVLRDKTDGLSELFTRIVASPGAAKPLLQKFEHASDNELFELFRAVKETLVPRTQDW